MEEGLRSTLQAVYVKAHRMSIDASWLPGRLVSFPPSLGDPRFAFVFDVDESMGGEVFEEANATLTGYAWQGVVAAALEERHGTSEKRLFDCESSTFCARSSDLSLLQEVAQIVRASLADKDLLRKYINGADKGLLS